MSSFFFSQKVVGGLYEKLPFANVSGTQSLVQLQ